MKDIFERKKVETVLVNPPAAQLAEVGYQLADRLAIFF